MSELTDERLNDLIECCRMVVEEFPSPDKTMHLDGAELLPALRELLLSRSHREAETRYIVLDHTGCEHVTEDRDHASELARSLAAHREAETGVAVERVWAEITEANRPVAETVLVAAFDNEVGEWVLALEDAPVDWQWSHFLRPGRPLASPQRETEGREITEEMVDRALAGYGNSEYSKAAIRDKLRSALTAALSVQEGT